MYKNESIKISPVMNGYKIEYDYRAMVPTTKNPDNWEYCDEEYFFATWPEVLTWVSAHVLETPPAKITAITNTQV